MVKKKKVKIYLLVLCMICSMLSASMPGVAVVHAANLDRSSYYKKSYTLTGNPVNDMVAVAREQLGQNYYGRYGAAWCAYFVSDVARLAGCSGVIPGDGWCATLYNNIKRAGGKDVSSPQAGDIVFYVCNRCSAAPWVHVGLMVDSRNSIEGNYDGKVSSVSGWYRDSANHTVASGAISRIYVRPAYKGVIPPDNKFIKDTKYNAVAGFRGYTLSGGKVELLESNLSTRIGYIYATDECTVHELYTNGWCKVTCPWSDGGTRTGYTKISNFIQSPSAALGEYKAASYINLYSKADLATQIYRIYPGDACKTIGKSGSATQVFMPMSGKGYYELGWAKLPSVTPTSLTVDKRYPTPFKCRILSNSNSVVCAYRGVNDSSTYLGHVYVNDDCVIQEVYTNGWCKFTCPFFGKVETVYGKISDFSSCNINPYSLKAPKYSKTYFKSDKKTEVGWVDPGDAVTVIAVSGNMSQIVYPADVGKRCGWIDSSALVERYTVSYNANGGSGAPAAQSANKGTDVTISSTVPKRTGYSFAGWGDKNGKVLYASGSKYSANANITLYAVWRQNEYTIKYNANGGEKAPKEQAQLYGESVIAESSLCSLEQGILVEYGIIDGGDQNGVALQRGFLAWNTKADGSGTVVKAGAKYTPNADVTLYAQYGKAKFTSENLPKAPERTGYTFDGWYDSQNKEKKIVAGQELDVGLSGICAKWTVNSYAVSYNANGGEGAPEAQTKEFGKVLKLSNAKPSRDGYIFQGWGLTANDGKVVYKSGDAYQENKNITLYAVWTEVKADLTSIAIATPPRKTTYEFGEGLSTDGLSLTCTYSPAKTETVTSGYTVTGYDSRKAGTQTLTVTYGGKTTTFTVTVKAQPEGKIAVVSIDDKVGAAPGELVQVNVQLTKNPGFSFMMLKLTYDPKQLELVEASNSISDNNLFMMDDTIMWDSASDVNVGSSTKEAMGTVTFRVKPDITLDKGLATCEIGITDVTCYNQKEEEVTVEANKGTIYVDTVRYGDINGDEKIDEKDVQALREYLITKKMPDGYSVQAADANGDGVIDPRDVIRLNQHIKDNSVTLGYDRNKAIGANGENLFTDDVKMSINNISEVKNGVFTMDVVMDENPGVAALNIAVDYNTEIMKLTGVSNGTVINGTVELMAFTDTSDGTETSGEGEKNLLFWTMDTVSNSTGTLATLTFRIKEGTEPGDYPVSAAVSSCYDGNEKSHYGASEISQVTVPFGEVAVESIALSSDTLTLEGGSVEELEANVEPLDATDKTVVWESSDAAVADVSEDGQVRALKKGSAVITATASGFSAKCTVMVTSDLTVDNSPLEEDPAKKADESGGQDKGDGKPGADVTPPTDNDGTESGDKQTEDNKKDEITYHLSTETGSAKIAAGKKVKMKVTGSNGKPLNNSKLKWKSSNKKIATVNSKGVVTLNKKSGGKKVTITATMKTGSKQKLKITVYSMKGAVKSVKISGAKAIKSGKSLKLKAAVKTTKGTANKKLRWNSSNTKIAKVSSSGKVKTVKGKKGTVKITATATDGSGKKATVKIKVK